MNSQEPWQGGGAQGSFQRAVREQRIGTGAAPCLPPKLSVCLQTACFHFWVPLSPSWIKHPFLGVLRDMPSPSHGVPVSIPMALAGARPLLTLPDCPVTSGNSLLSPLGAATSGSQTFPHTLVSSGLLQTPVPGAGTSLGTACCHPHYKGLSALQTNHPACNTAATLHCLALSGMQKGAGGFARQESAVPAKPQLSPAGLEATTTANWALRRFSSETSLLFYVAVASWTYIV